MEWRVHPPGPLFSTVGFIATISSNTDWLVYVALPNNTRTMITGSNKPFLGVLKTLRNHTVIIGLYVCGIAWLDLQYHLESYNFPVAVVVAPATFIGLLLGFRTNASYGRWWEARIIWGAIVNDSRTWVRQLIEFEKTTSANQAHPLDDQIRKMALRQSGWCFALCSSLRGEEPYPELEGLIESSEIEKLRSQKNVPNAILQTQALDLRKLYDDQRIELFTFVEMERTLTRLTNSMGGCERIRNTVFPVSYSRMVTALIYVFVLLLPFGLVNVPPAPLIAASLCLSMSFLLIDRIAQFLQDPFSKHPSDTPMLTLSRTIEINIRQMLGETELPEPIKPVDGIAW